LENTDNSACLSNIFFGNFTAYYSHCKLMETIKPFLILESASQYLSKSYLEKIHFHKFGNYLFPCYMNASKCPPSILDVAKTAGLSVGTVPRAINNQPSVSKDAMNAVRRAMALHRTFAASSPLSVKAVAAVVPPSATALQRTYLIIIKNADSIGWKLVNRFDLRG